MSELRLSADASRSLRRMIRREMVDVCWINNWDVDISEDRGWLRSRFRFTVTVPDGEATRARTVLTAWAEQMSRPRQ